MKRLTGTLAAAMLLLVVAASPAAAVGGWTFSMDDRNEDGYVCWSATRDGRGQAAWTDTRNDMSCPKNTQRIFDF